MLSITFRSSLVLLAATFSVISVNAQDASSSSLSTTSATQLYAIPAGALDETLSRIARMNGQSLSANPALVAGKQAPQITGNLTAEAALQQAIDNSGLELVKLANGGWSLRALHKGDERTLAPVKVQAARSEFTDGTHAYTIGATTTATRLPLSPRETPQTLTVVTRQQMDDFAMTDVDEVLESTSGVHVFDRGSNGAFYYSRGFAMQSQYDGLPNPVGIGEWNMNPSPDSAFLDHVEVLQGASGLLTGAGEPGGTINLVRKRPTREFKSHIEAQLGSWDKRRLVGDVSGALLTSGAVRGRAVGLWDDSDSFVDYVFDKKQGFYGVIDADLTPTTIISGSVQYQQNDGRDHGGVPMGPDGSDLAFKRSSFFANANSSTQREQLLYTLSVEQQLPGDWLLRAAYNDNKTDVNIVNGSFTSGGPLNVVTGSGLNLMQFRHLDREFTSNGLDLYATGPLTLFGREHELVLGGNGVEMHERSLNSGNRATPINVYNFNPSLLPTPAGIRATLPPEDETQQYGAYGVARLNLADSLKVIIGSRVSWYSYEDPDGVQTHNEDAEVSPYAGVIYDLNRQYSVYVSYSDIFTPQSNLSRSGNPIDPIVGVNYETGIKGEFYDGRLNAAIAIFRLEQTNLPTQDEDFGDDPTNICGGWCYIAEDKVISQGVDLSLNGEIAPDWNIGAGYTYVKSKYASGELKDDSYRTDVPENLLRIFSSYRLPSTGWTIGGNLNLQSRFYNKGVRNGIAWQVEQGGLATVGLMAKYQISKQAQVSLTADNIFDRRYFASTNSLYYVPYGEPRTFSVSAKYEF